MQKSETDVVSFLVCHHARQSIYNYFKAFLLLNDEEPPSGASVEDLYQLCLKKDTQFENIDLSPVECKKDNSNSEYCLQPKEVGTCLQTARSLEKIFKKIPELPS